MWRHILLDKSRRDIFNEHHFVLKISFYPTNIPKKLQKKPKTSQNFVKPGRIRLDALFNAKTHIDR